VVTFVGIPKGAADEQQGEHAQGDQKPE